MAGLVLVVLSFSNDRDERIDEFDSAALVWEEFHRDIFSQLEASAAANWTLGVGGGSGLMRMQLSGDIMWGFQDSEGAEGIVDFEPLRLVAGVDLPGYYGNTSMPWAPLPTRAAAPTVVFEFNLSWPGADGSPPEHSAFSTEAFPLAFEETSPAPGTATSGARRCQQQRRGIWSGGQCHRVKRLAGVCLQIGRLEDAEPWLPRPRLAGDGGSYGCDPKGGWEPATYEDDPCWGPNAAAVADCLSLRPRHFVNVTLRSSSDPLFSAEELTEDTFDFGISPVTQRVMGGAAAAVGLVLGLAPLAWYCEPRCFQEDDEEREGLALPATRLGRV